MLKLSDRRCAQLGLFAAMAVLAICIATLLLAPRRSRPVAAADVGTLAPDFELLDSTGQPVTLSQFHGRVVVLFFSGLSCPRSAQYNERVERLARQFGGDGRVQFLAVNVPSDEKLDPFLVRSDPRVSQRSYPTLLDERSAVSARYSAPGTPFMVVIDPHGAVRYRGPFDNSPDLAFATRTFCTDALRTVLDSTTVTLASNGGETDRNRAN